MEPLVIVELEGSLATIRLNKPQALNALCATMSKQLIDALEMCSSCSDIRAVVLTGNGRAFCTGSDLSAPVPVPGLSSAERGDLLLSQYFNPVIQTIQALRKPVIVAINGIAVGGGVGLALSGDIAIMKSSAEFRLNFAPKLGLVPDLGCTWVLPRLVGRARAIGMAITGEAIDARKAAEWGLVWAAVGDTEFESFVARLARQVAEGPAEAFCAIRELIDDSAASSSLGVQLERERVVQTRLMGGANFAEGVQAFKEKRAPRFTVD